ncbi:MAG: primosomal protein N' [Clostridiales bacterium]|nr:primosomal protein N' [Clostridiales bacterium]
MVAEVVLRESVWNTNKAYDYLVPEELSEKIKVGQYIRVPFGNGNRPCVALVMKLKEEAQVKEGARAFRMKSIHSIVEEEPVLNQEQLEILHFLTKRYASTYGSAMHQMVPALVTKRTGRSQLVVSLVSEEKARDAIDSESISSLPQLRALQWLLEVEEMPLSDLMQELSISRSPIDTLAKNGLVTIRSVHFSAEQRAEIGDAAVMETSEKQEAHILNPEQQAAVDAILQAEGNKEFLLFGVTGSGKTEVYLQVTEQILKQGGSVLYLVPEISLTPQTVSRIKSRFPEKIAVLHSRLTAKERYDSWKRIQRGEVRIVVGARSAVFAPVCDLKLIIMDEEHDSSYKADTMLRYSARDVARYRAKKAGIKLLLGSATPSIETFYAAKLGYMQLLTLKNRAVGEAILPKVELVDMQQELDAGNRSIFSRKLYTAMKQALSRGEQVMLLLNRRGYSRNIFCHSCRSMVMCPECDVPMTLHTKTMGGKRLLICHYCGKISPVPDTCPSCGSEYIAERGDGIQKLEDWVTEDFPGTRVLRMDQDTTSTRHAHAQILEKFRNHEADILIGTQMIAKGHDFPKVSVVGVLGADTVLFQSDYRARERAFQLLAQISGRAGRGDIEGHVFIQTFCPDSPIYNMAATQDYEKFFNSEIRYREDLAYPPFRALGGILVTHENEEACRNQAEMVAGTLREMAKNLGTDMLILGPCPANMPKVMNRFRYQIVVRAKNKALLSDGFLKLQQSYAGYGYSISVDIDTMW